MTGFHGHHGVDARARSAMAGTDATAMIGSLRRSTGTPPRSTEFEMRRPLLVLSLLLLAACSDGRRFSPEAWRAEDPLRRNTLTSDLLARRLLIGKGEGEVYEMLGPSRSFGRDTATWNIGVDAQTGAQMVLQVDFRDGVATQAAVHRE